MASDRQRMQGTAAAAPPAPPAPTASNVPPASAPSTTSTPGAALLPGTRPYTLRPLLHDVPLSADAKDEDIKINCVDYYGMRALDAARESLACLADHPLPPGQMATSTSAPAPPSSSTSFASPPIPPIPAVHLPLSSHHGCPRYIPNPPVASMVRALVCSKSSCCHESARLVSCATGPSPSTRCPS